MTADYCQDTRSTEQWLQDEQWAADQRRWEEYLESLPGADDDFEDSPFEQEYRRELEARGEDWPGHKIGRSDTHGRHQSARTRAHRLARGTTE
jgi:hypothetical protein